MAGRRFTIPSEFTLGAHRFTVTRCSAEELEKAAGAPAYGLFLPESQEILVHKPGRGISASLCAQTFWHEFMHALLWTMGHKDAYNEKMIEQASHLLKQFWDSRRP